MTATPMLRFGLALAASVALAACTAAQRVEDLATGGPHLTPVENPVERQDYHPIRMPVPTPQVVEQNANSLWQSGSRAFFRDQRAANVGDILTVLIEIDDEARLNNSTERERSNAETAGAPALMGFETEWLEEILPDEYSAEDLVDLASTSQSRGEGEIRRNEEIELQLAAVVTDVLPNGNMAIFGRQEVLVNYERRDLVVAGVIRPEDITSQNTISYQQIAEARISYGGRGQLTDVQQPRYGQQLYDIVFPF